MASLSFNDAPGPVVFNFCELPVWERSGADVEGVLALKLAAEVRELAELVTLAAVRVRRAACIDSDRPVFAVDTASKVEVVLAVGASCEVVDASVAVGGTVVWPPLQVEVVLAVGDATGFTKGSEATAREHAEVEVEVVNERDGGAMCEYADAKCTPMPPYKASRTGDGGGGACKLEAVVHSLGSEAAERWGAAAIIRVAAVA